MIIYQIKVSIISLRLLLKAENIKDISVEILFLSYILSDLSSFIWIWIL
ncbi:hypothetical protein LCGC14_0706930 [marine sediment metagenome]|uniref:Uncharacterized protein n=1 Tax=marine sediment metagenome TaxID=412755 RepID=A0A0F9QG58_9ZZZZ|nr:MAG: hypothetical protein Lokiarch_10990 [Candidatus Lokiarchaeum sp. GC14_75]